MGVMKMGNNVPRAGIEPTSLAFRACVNITPHRLSDVTNIPTAACLCGAFLQRSVQTTTVAKTMYDKIRHSVLTHGTFLNNHAVAPFHVKQGTH